jgi:diacylglycerol kinase (ATP)
VTEREKLQGLGRIQRAFVSSAKGFVGAFREEQAFRQELLFACLALPLGLWLGHSGVERALLSAPVLLILIVE